MNNQSVNLRSLLDNNKLVGNNFISWRRNIRIILRAERIGFTVEQPFPQPLPDNATLDQLNEREQHVRCYEQAQCIMLGSIVDDLQKQCENMNSYDMMQHLQTLFEGQARNERFNVSRDTYNAAVQLHSQADPTVVFTPADLLEIFVGRLESYNQPRENSHEYFANIYRDVQKRLKGLQLLAVDPELASEVRSSLILDTVQRETGLEEEDIRHWRGKFDSPELRIIDEEIATDIQQSKSK